jgi:hypothetical protein
LAGEVVDGRQRNVLGREGFGSGKEWERHIASSRRVFSIGPATSA